MVTPILFIDRLGTGGWPIVFIVLAMYNNHEQSFGLIEATTFP